MSFSIFEVGMLICFGFSWPMAIWKTIKVKNPAGKSYWFMALIIVGYLCGCTHKIIYNFDIVFWLYLLNTVLVATDLLLCLYYTQKNKKQANINA